MILINFSHPITPDQIARVEEITGQRMEQVVNIPVQFDNDRPFDPQIDTLMHALPLSSHTMQTAQIVVNPPALNFITALLLAELHGRMGYFPPVVRLRPASGSLPPRYEVAEILNLQSRRDNARRQRNTAEPEA